MPFLTGPNEFEEEFRFIHPDGDYRWIITEGIHRCADGAEYPVEIGASYFEFEGQRYLPVVPRDISERKYAELEMLRINRFLRTLSACNETLVHAINEEKRLQAMCLVVEVGEFALAGVGLTHDVQVLSIQAHFGGGADDFAKPGIQDAKIVDICMQVSSEQGFELQ